MRLATCIAVITLLSSCMPAMQLKPVENTVPEDAQVLVSGEIIHLKNAPFSFQGDFVFRAGAHAVVELHFAQGQDVASEVIAATTIEDITSFPILFSSKGNAQTAFERRGEYFLQVKVFQNNSNELIEGDLLNESTIELRGLSANVRAEVTGLELCNSEGAGRFCTSLKR